MSDAATEPIPQQSDLKRQAIYYAGLIWTLVRTDFKSRYHGTIGGYLWALAKPVSMLFVLLAVFSLVFSVDSNYKLNLIIGLFLWDFFSESTKTGLICMHSKSFVLTRARFPSWIVVVTSCSNAVITMSLFSLVVCLYITLFHQPLGLVHIGLFVVYLVCFVLIVIGFSLAAGVLFLYYRDLNQIWELTLQAGFFIAPVIWPISLVPERYHLPLYFWLPTPVIQFSRQVLVGQEIPSLRAHILLLAATVVVLAIGILSYRRWASRALEEL
jgi:lipopolysaccharide transport system permease protein